MCKCVLYCCYGVATQLQFNKYIICHISTPILGLFVDCSRVNFTLLLPCFSTGVPSSVSHRTKQRKPNSYSRYYTAPPEMCKMLNVGLIFCCSTTPRRWLSSAATRSCFNTCYELYFILLSVLVSGSAYSKNMYGVGNITKSCALPKFVATQHFWL